MQLTVVDVYVTRNSSDVEQLDVAKKSLEAFRSSEFAVHDDRVVQVHRLIAVVPDQRPTLYHVEENQFLGRISQLLVDQMPPLLADQANSKSIV